MKYLDAFELEAMMEEWGCSFLGIAFFVGFILLCAAIGYGAL